MAGQMCLTIPVICCFIITASAASLDITPRGETHSKPEGSSMVFTCSAIDLTPTIKAELRWADRNGRDIIETTGPMYIEKIGEQSLKLYIQFIEQQHAGIYTCSGVLNGNQVELKTELQLYHPPIITEQMGDMSGVEDHNVTLKCHATGKPLPKYEFYKDGGDWQLFTENHRVVDNNNGMIHFVPLNAEDEGDYKCIARNDVGTASTEGFLEVIIKPRIYELSDTQGPEGGTGSIICKSSGSPPPSMTWRKSPANDYDYDDGPNENGRIVVNSINPGELQLTISDLTPDDTSNYICSATNAGGNYQQNGTLAVQFPPTFADDHPTEVFIWEGKTRNITCTALGEPEPYIRWYRNNEWIERNNETYRIYNIGRNGYLQVTARSDNKQFIYGNYDCRAYNDYGEGEIAIRLREAFPPRFADDHPTEVFIWEGKTRNITCTALGEPEPYIRWYRNNEWIERNNETYRICNIGRNGYLQVTARSDNIQFIYGNYDCRAYNDYGEGEIAIRLREACPGLNETGPGLNETGPGLNVTGSVEIFYERRNSNFEVSGKNDTLAALPIFQELLENTEQMMQGDVYRFDNGEYRVVASLDDFTKIRATFSGLEAPDIDLLRLKHMEVFLDQGWTSASSFVDQNVVYINWEKN